MNLENEFSNAKSQLVCAQSSFNEHDYDSALASLTKVYEYTRVLLQSVYKLNVESARAERPAGEDSGGS
ncbi:hypothetical protein ES708_08950 [subsurface metagenome]